MNATMERRLFTREVTVRPCTLFRRQTQRFVAARTCDISRGGALLEVETARPLSPGEKLEVGVAWSASPIISRTSLVEARVVRVLVQEPRRQVVAVRFDRAEAALAAA